jgi:hypothetical protein
MSKDGFLVAIRRLAKQGVVSPARGRGTIFSGLTGAPLLLLDDGRLSTDDGDVLARIQVQVGAKPAFWSHMPRQIVCSGAHPNRRRPARSMARATCEKRPATIARTLLPIELDH